MSFRIGSIPVKVHAAFFFMALFLGMNIQDPRLIAIWVVVVFASVLVHELGHALAGRAFGLSPRIDLHSMGGTTSWTAPIELGHGRRIVISLAGPCAGFLLGVLVIAWKLKAGAHPNPFVRFAVGQLVYVNIGWGIFNLLPLLPLDGGNVMRSVLDVLTKGRGEKPARAVSVALCAALLALAIWRQSVWIGLLALLFGMTNVRALRDVGRRRADEALAAVLEKARDAVEKQDGAEAIALLRPALSAGASPELRAAGVQILAYALLLEAQWSELVPLLDRERDMLGPDELARFARTARELGRTAEAERIEAIGKAPAPLEDFKA